MKLHPIETAPRDGQYVLVAGDSGYTTTPLRFEACRFDAEYRPLSPWVNHSNDCFTDSGGPALYWTPLPNEGPVAQVVSECCGVHVDLAASIPLCVRCNGELLFHPVLVYPVWRSRHLAGHNDRCRIPNENAATVTASSPKESNKQQPEDSTAPVGGQDFCKCLTPFGTRTCHHCGKDIKP